MKNIIITLALLIGFLNTKAQHTLQYNQALLISTAGGTVPANAVWKVVSILPSSLPLVSYPQYYIAPTAGTFAITVNGSTIYTSSISSSFGLSDNNYCSTNSNGLALPIWLPAGTTLAAGTNIEYISVIEFLVQ